MLYLVILVRINPCSETPCDHRCCPKSFLNCFTPFRIHSYPNVPPAHEFAQKRHCSGPERMVAHLLSS